MSFIILSLFWITLFSVYGIILKIVSIGKIWKEKPGTYWADPPREAGMEYQF